MVKKAIQLSLLALVLGLAGGYYYIQYVPEVDPNYDNAPVTGVKVKAIEQLLPLSPLIKNPAGISYNEKTNTFLVSTDDRVFAEISADFSRVLFSTTISNSPLSIGDTEGVSYLGQGKVALTGENGVVIILVRRGAINWIEIERFAIKGFNKSTQLGSAAYDASTQTLYTAQKKGVKKMLYAIDLATRETTVIELTLASNLVQKSNRHWDEFTIAGLTFDKGKLYAISEAFSAMLTIELNGTITEVTGLAGIQESAGVTVKDNQFYFIGDAENYLPEPPIYILNQD
jgi:uncharacterized protein YjiK